MRLVRPGRGRDPLTTATLERSTGSVVPPAVPHEARRMSFAKVLLALSGLVLFGPGPASGQVRREFDPVPAANATSTFEVEVRVRTQDGLRELSAAVPGITVELGVAGEGSAPRFSDSPVLARVTSDAAGRIRETLEVPVHWKDDPDARVWARVETPGYRRWTARQSLTDRREMRLWTRRGGDVFGRVRTDAGEPVANARVWVFAEDHDGYVYHGQRRTNGDGLFAVSHAAAGRFVVHARASGIGSGRTEVLELDPLEPPPPVEIEVGGGTPLLGRLVDPAGDPVGGAVVAAVPLSLPGLPSYPQCFEAEGEGGLFGDVGRTDGEGRVSFPSLVPGGYALHAGWEAPRTDGLEVEAERLGKRLAEVEVRVGSEPLEWVLPQHRLEVRVTDSRGGPVDVYLRGEDGDPVRSHLILHRLEAGGAQRAHAPFANVGDLLVVPVEPDREYVLSWHHPTIPYAERRVHVPRGPYRTPVELRLGPAGAPGRILVHVVGPKGDPLPVMSMARIFSASSGIEILPSKRLELPRWRAVEGGWSTSLPPGRFRVTARVATLGQECTLPEEPPVPDFLPGSGEVTVEAGRESRVEIRLPAAGRLELVAADPRADYRTEYERFFRTAEAPNTLRPDLAREALDGGTAVLIGRSGERVEGLTFDSPYTPAYVLGWIVPGWTSRCRTPLPPGEWTLRIEDEGRSLFEREVVIREGETTVVRW